MLRITVELVPFGDDRYSKKIGSMLIANDGSGNGCVDNYAWTAEDDRGNSIEGKLEEHDRSMSVWNLIGKCLNQH